MNHQARTLLLSAIASASIVIPPCALGEVSQTPLPVTQETKPRVMFVISNDHALYYKAYTDWNDLDEDEDEEGTLDTTYKNGFEYYGYFDPTKCYDYDAGDSRFEPKAVTANRYCDEVSGSWSGNFLNWASMSRMDIVRKVLYGGFRSTDTPDTTVLERSFLPTDAHSFAKHYKGDDVAKLTPFNVGELTLCNTTYASGGQSQNITNPPLIRVAKGDFRYWAANERWQCTWDNERGDNSSGSNTTGSHTSDPNKATDGLGEKGYVARVQVCLPSLLGGENCKRYPGGSYKPVGLLHDYGEDDEILFGLISGSYQKNKSGGVLRKNVASFKNEVNTTTYGTFTGAAGIVKTLNSLRIARYNYDDGTYNVSDSCIWGLSSFTDGNCSNWGNPVSEMYLEAIRYYAGLSANSTFGATDNVYIPGLESATWTDPIDEDSWCAHCDVIVFNASELSYDNDSLSTSGLTDLTSAAAETDAVGEAELIKGHYWFVGENGSDNNQLCTAKMVNAFGSVEGACPGAPRLDGTYLVSGLAHWAHTNDIRSDREEEQNITTRAVTLLPAAPRIVIPVPGSKRTLSILPACRNTKPDPDGNCAIVDFKILEQDVEAGTGTAYVNWEDSEQGGDYDQDMKGILEYSLNASGNTITVTTKVDAKSTDHSMGFGYVISGTTQDGFHAHSGINKFSFYDSTGVPGCNNCDPDPCPGGGSHCNVAEAATSHVYTIGDSTAGLLEEPLWYAAKYGSFNDTDKNGLPDKRPEWDQDDDDRPDGFYSANDPAELGPSLARFLEVIAATTSSTSVAINSVTLRTGARIYQALYDTKDWSGDLIAFPLNEEDGSLEKPAWHGRDVLNQQADRRIITTREADGDEAQRGAPFRWGDLASSQQDSLRFRCDSCASADVEDGEALLDYLRGTSDDEVQNRGEFRDREFVLGDMVNSAPAYVGAPRSYYPDSIEEAKYSAFADAHASRDPVLYVGGNDGMLHAFDDADGSELFGYVPRAVYKNLYRLTALDYQENHHFYVDGDPVAADAYFGGAWHTILVTGLGAGGKGVFALDITDPDAFRTSETTAAAKVLWDITGEDDGFADLGYAFSTPAIARLPDNDHDGAWAVVFGNGYESDDGRAVLYIVDAATGEPLHTVVADDVCSHNGLSSVASIDYDGDAIVDYIYAGDLVGNMWRFEPNGLSGWKVSFDGKPLLRADVGDCAGSSGNEGGGGGDDGDGGGGTTEPVLVEVCEWVLKNPRKPKKGYKKVCRWEPAPTTEGDPSGSDPSGSESAGSESTEIRTPITSRPEVIRHPFGGLLVLFGTGRYYQPTDRSPNTNSVNSFFGIWDRLGNDGDIRRAHLLKQEIEREVSLAGRKWRVTSAHEIHWHLAAGKPADTPPKTHLGWYLDLLRPDGTREGEMQVYEARARTTLGAEMRIIFTTLIPSDSPCDHGGDGWLMELNARDGAQIDEYVFDINGDGVFDEKDLVEITIPGVDGQPTTIGVSPGGVLIEGIPQPPSIVADSDGNYERKYINTSHNGKIEIIGERPEDIGRGSWIELYRNP